MLWFFFAQQLMHGRQPARTIGKPTNKQYLEFRWTVTDELQPFQVRSEARCESNRFEFFSFVSLFILLFSKKAKLSPHLLYLLNLFSEYFESVVPLVTGTLSRLAMSRATLARNSSTYMVSISLTTNLGSALRLWIEDVKKKKNKHIRWVNRTTRRTNETRKLMTGQRTNWLTY